MTITADHVADWHDAGEGHYWWNDPTADTYLVTADKIAPADGALYLMPWDAMWFAQWSGDWQAAADQLNSILERQEI